VSTTDSSAVASAAIARALRDQREDLVRTLLDRRGHVPSYAILEGEALASLADDVTAFVDALADALDHDRPLGTEDVAFLRPAIARRAARGDWIDTTQALRVLQRTFYERATALAEETGDAAAVAAVGSRLLELMDVAGVLAGEAWIEAQEVSRSGGAQRRIDLLDALLAGHDPATAGLGDLAAELDLTAGTGVLAISARAVRSDGAARALTSAVGAFARAGSPSVLPLARLQQDEIVVLRPVSAEAIDDLVAALERTWRRLADGPVRLAVGVSARHLLPGGAPDALADARRARDRVPTGGGILALPALGPLDWMTLRSGATTWTLVPERTRRFLEQDSAQGGQLIHTFRSYVASDLNVKLAARRLHLHVNTARYRLARIAERTGLDLRSLDDVIALHVATMLHEQRSRTPDA